MAPPRELPHQLLGALEAVIPLDHRQADDRVAGRRDAFHDSPPGTEPSPRRLRRKRKPHGQLLEPSQPADGRPQQAISSRAARGQRPDGLFEGAEDGPGVAGVDRAELLAQLADLLVSRGERGLKPAEPNSPSGIGAVRTGRGGRRKSVDMAAHPCGIRIVRSRPDAVAVRRTGDPAFYAGSPVRSRRTRLKRSRRSRWRTRCARGRPASRRPCRRTPSSRSASPGRSRRAPARGGSPSPRARSAR